MPRRAFPFAATGAALLTGASANATTPSRLWWGVERIVVACDVDAGAESMKAALCQAITDFNKTFAVA